MLKQFHKIKESGCIVKATSCGIKVTDNDKFYDIWMNDNLTNELECGGCKQDKTRFTL